MVQQDATITLSTSVALLMRAGVTQEHQLIDFGTSLAFAAWLAHVVEAPLDALAALSAHMLDPAAQPVATFLLRHAAAGHTDREEDRDLALRAARACRSGLARAVVSALAAPRRPAQLAAMLALRAVLVTSATSKTARIAWIGDPAALSAASEAFVPLAVCAAAAATAASALPRLVLEANNTIVDVFGSLASMALALDAERDGPAPPAIVTGAAARNDVLWKHVGSYTSALVRLAEWHRGPEGTTLADGVAVARRVLDKLGRSKDQGDLADYNAGMHKSGASSFAVSLRAWHAASTWSVAARVETGALAVSRPRAAKELLESTVAGWARVLAHPDSDAPSESEGFSAAVRLVHDCILLGVYGRAVTAALWHSHPDVLQAASSLLVTRALRARDADVRALGASLLKTMMPVDASAAERIASTPIGAVDDLLGLLSSSDGASEYVVQLVADSAVQRPHLLLPALFRLMANTSSDAERSNAVNIIARVAQRENLPESVTTRLATELLRRCDDESLHVRCNAAAVFGRIPYTVAVPQLVDQATMRDPTGNRRSCATAALLAVLAATPADQLPRCLRTMVAASPEDAAAKPMAITTPADIGNMVAVAQGSPAASDTASMRRSVVDHVMAKWLGHATRDWDAIGCELVESLRRPDGQNPDVVRVYARAAPRIFSLHCQRTWDAATTIFRETVANSDAVLFAALLVVLRCVELDTDAPLLTDEFGALVEAAITQPKHPLLSASPDAARLLLEVYARAELCQVLQRSEQWLAADSLALRRVLYVAVSAFTARIGSQHRERLQHISTFLAAASHVTKDETDERAFADTVAAALVLESTPAAWEALLAATRGNAATEAEAAFFNDRQFLAVLRATALVRNHPDAPSSVAKCLSGLWPKIIGSANHACASREFDSAALAITVAFNVVHAVRSVPAEDLEAALNFAVGCSNFDGAVRIRSEGIKLLAAVVTHCSDDLAAVASETLQRIQRTVSQHALLDTDGDTRRLAEVLEAALTG